MERERERGGKGGYKKSPQIINMYDRTVRYNVIPPTCTVCKQEHPRRESESDKDVSAV